MNLDKFLGCIFGVAIGDTQLTLATIDALTESDGIFDMDAIARAHISAYKEERRGWGKSTRGACERLTKGAGWNWTNSGDRDGAGNGVMMKIAPLGLWQTMAVEDIRPFVNKCIEYGKMTHLGTPAIVAGTLHAVSIATFAGRKDSFVRVPTFLSYLYELAKGLEAELPPWKDKISSQIINIMAYIDYGRRGNLGKQSPEDIASLFGGGTSYAYHSFGLAYAIFAKSACNPDNPDPFNAVFEAVNAGGDTDTNASIVGSLVGALHGMRAIPQELVEGVEKSGEIRERTEKFFEACKRRAK